MAILYSDAYLSLRYHPEMAHVRLVRTDQQFQSVSRVASSMRECAHALDGVNVSRLGLLLDWRLAPLVTDPVMIKHLVQQSDLFAAGFARRALLVSTPVGIMQSERIARTINHTKPMLFNDEAAAVAYVKGESSEAG